MPGGCDGWPFVVHKKSGEYDRTAAKCVPHVCKPMAVSTVRQVYSIISGTLNASLRWDWISSNPTKAAQRPKQKPPQPDPPSPAMAASWSKPPLRWTRTGGRWSGWLLLRRRVGREKDTKTHQMRRIALDTETIVLLREHKDRCRLRMAELGIEFSDDMYVFSGVRDFDPHKSCGFSRIRRRLDRCT